MVDLSSVDSLLRWLVYSGGAVIVMSKLLELIPAWGKLAPQAKYYINMVLDVALALGAYALLIYVPADVWTMLNPWFLIICGTVLAYSGGQVVHKLTK